MPSLRDHLKNAHRYTDADLTDASKTSGGLIGDHGRHHKALGELRGGTLDAETTSTVTQIDDAHHRR